MVSIIDPLLRIHQCQAFFTGLILYALILKKRNKTTARRWEKGRTPNVTESSVDCTIFSSVIFRPDLLWHKTQK